MCNDDYEVPIKIFLEKYTFITSSKDDLIGLATFLVDNSIPFLNIPIRRNSKREIDVDFSEVDDLDGEYSLEDIKRELIKQIKEMYP